MPAFIYDSFDHGLAIGYAANQDAADHLWDESKPASWADKFEPYLPTAKDWMDNGFQCGCTNCGHIVSIDEICDQCLDEEDCPFDGTLIGEPTFDDNGDVYCNQQCRDAHKAYMTKIRAEQLAKNSIV